MTDRVTGDWLVQAATQALFDAYESAGWRLFLVGGCVRDALLGRPVSDIDMSSDAPPDTARAFLQKAGFKVIPTGIEHGTLTVVSDGVAHEVTTFRKDVTTDGRRAVVSFADTLEEDAQRRDFTINALYADRHGAVTDLVGGLHDLNPVVVRFIGDAASRIREDFLRILRFFRFHAHFAAADAGFDSQSLSAIADNLDGLERLSRERIGAELLKLLAAPDPGPAVAGMAQCGVLTRILPGADPRALGPFMHFEDMLGLAPNNLGRLASIADANMAESLRLSRGQLRDLTAWRAAALSGQGAGEMAYRLGHDGGATAVALRAAFLEHPPTADDIRALAIGGTANFPVSAKDLQPDYTGPALGEKLRSLEADWIASDFAKSKAQLLG